VRTILRAVTIESLPNPASYLLLTLLLGHGPVAQAQDLLLLTFASGPPPDTTYSTQAVTSLTAVDGRRVVLARSRGTGYQTQPSGVLWPWTQVQEIPRDAMHLAITPTRQGDEVILDIQFNSRKGDEAVLYASTVKGRLGHWIPLVQPANTVNFTGGNHYSTATDRQRLAIRVELAEPP